MSSSDTPNSANLNLRKKKKNSNHNQRLNTDQENMSAIQDCHSCDEKERSKAAVSTFSIQSEVKSSSLGIQSTSNLYDNTTAHQSNNSNSNSSATIASTTPNNAANILQIQSSKSLDLNPVMKSKSHSTSNHKQLKPISKVESKNFQILQNS